MITISIGVFPGKIDTIVLESGTTVASALELAGLVQSDEQEIKVDGEAVETNYQLSESDNMVLLSKRLKSA